MTWSASVACWMPKSRPSSSAGSGTSLMRGSCPRHSETLRRSPVRRERVTAAASAQWARMT
jgi:hypothetical protein